MKFSLFATLKKNAGFTLIELLVVIAIIAVLSTIALSAFGNAQVRSRDAKRMGDMKAYADAFEQYYGTGNTYAACGTIVSANLAGTPTEPKSGWTAYNCSTPGVAPFDRYCVCALLETTGKGNASTTCGANGAPPTWGVGNYFCVRNLQ